MSIAQFAKTGGHIGALVGAVAGITISLSLIPYHCASEVPLGKVRDGFLDEHLGNEPFDQITLNQKISYLMDHMSHYVFKPNDQRFEAFWKCTALWSPLATISWSLQIAALGAMIGGVCGCGRGLYNRALHRT